MRTLALVAAVLLMGAGCTDDALYTYCESSRQCGSRTYYEDDDVEYTVDLECIEVTVHIDATRTTVGNFCTLPCESTRDCGSRVGLGTGRCIRLAGDDESFCYQSCDDDPDVCYPSSTCVTLTVDGRPAPVCVPTRRPGD